MRFNTLKNTKYHYNILGLQLQISNPIAPSIMIIKLEQQIDCPTLCRRIGKMIERYAKENRLQDKAISIKIVEIVDGGDKHIPKLEYKTLS
jgi:hypothetical protein